MVHKRLHRDIKLKMAFCYGKNTDTRWLHNVTRCIDYLLRIESAQLPPVHGEQKTMSSSCPDMNMLRVCEISGTHSGVSEDSILLGLVNNYLRFGSDLCLNNQNLCTPMPIPVAARSKAWVCGRSLAGIVGLNPA